VLRAFAGGPRPVPDATGLSGSSPAILLLSDWLRRIAPARLPVLIHGETGSGKELVARALHRLSPRGASPFVGLNCAALNEGLLDAELFGAKRGAFTGADRDRPGLFRLADTGTLFLDEVGEMSAQFQRKLLRAIQERTVRPVGGDHEEPVDVRILAATHRNLEERVRNGSFREDLYFRLAVLEVRVPPLRERLEDLEPIVAELGPRIRGETSYRLPRLTPAAWRALRRHSWPGNVRELHAVLARAVLRSAGRMISARHLGLDDPAPGPPNPAETASILERKMIERALSQAAGNLTQAAERIGWTRQKLYRRMRTLDVRLPAKSR